MQPITQLLSAWRNGDSDALGQLTPLVYRDLRRIAAVRLRTESHAATIQPTALVHEAYIRLAGCRPPQLENRSHFYGVAGRLMSQIVIQDARARNAGKRGAGAASVPFDEAEAVPAQADFQALQDALDALSSEDSRKATIVALRYFHGMTSPEIASELGVSLSTVEREMRLAIAWLHRWLTV